MSLELNGRASPARSIETVLRRPDGSVDIAAYARIAHRERAAAVVGSAREAIHVVREMLSVIRARLAQLARSGPASGKHHAHMG